MARERTLKIVGLGGSLGSGSTSLQALKTVLAHAEDLGAETELFDVREMNLGSYDPESTTPPPWAQRMADAMHNADAIVWASPLYHGTVSGAFKNALDWLELLSGRKPAYLTGKPIALVSTAGGAHGLQAINTMEFAVRALRAWTIPFVVPIARSHTAFDATGTVVDAAVARQLNQLAGELVAAARRFAPATSVSSETNEDATHVPQPAQSTANSTTRVLSAVSRGAIAQ